MSSTVIIPTIGRITLLKAVESVLRENLDLIVVVDGQHAIPKLPKDVNVVRLGRRFGNYGSMCYNVGAYLTKTDFFISLADDDELGDDFGKNISKVIESNPRIDIWIPEIVFNDGGIAGTPELGFSIGNVCAPIYRTEILAEVPFSHDMSKDNINFTDFSHIIACVYKGYKVSWATTLKYLVRPNLLKRRGFGDILKMI